MSKRRLIYKAPIDLPGDLRRKVLRRAPNRGLYQAVSPLPGVIPEDPQDRKGYTISRILENSDILVATSVMGRGFVGRQISITTTPTRIVEGRYLRGYLLTNPTAAAGLTTTATLLASANRSATGNTQSTPLGVASYNTVRLFLDITAVNGVGAVEIDVQTQDPVSSNWATAQSDVFGSPSAVGTFYANLGELGVDRSLAVAFNVTMTDATFSVGAILKGGLAGGSTGLPNTIYLGPDSNVNSTTGYPLIEGAELKLFFRPNTELWAVSQISGGVTLNVFDLQ